MHLTKTLGIVAALLISAASVSKQSEEARRVSEATVIIGEMMAAGDKAVPRAILTRPKASPCFRPSSRADLSSEASAATAS